MIDVTKLVAKLTAMGHTAADIVDVLQETTIVPVYAMEAATSRATLRDSDPTRERKRKADRDRVAAKRSLAKTKTEGATLDATKRDIAATPSGDIAECRGDTSRERAPTYAQVVTPSLPSLRSEESLTPTQEPTVPSSTPTPEPEKPPPKTKRGTRISEDWTPSDRGREMARDAGLDEMETEDAAREFRNYWLSRSRNATHVRWDLVWQNRVDVLGRDKRQKLARQVGPRPGGRGSWGLADHLMWERSQDGD